ncbi:MAG: methyltransferase domain-containing protein [Treponema sp.]|nr:methyltransferase domain-containing protein [Treponema sp.]
MHQKFDPRHMARLDSPERREMLPPERILGEFALSEGETLLDVGAGIGFFSLPAAGMVGPGGRVIALDSSAEMEAELERRVALSGLANLEAKVSGEYDFGLDEGRADLALLCTVLHEVEEPVRLLRETFRCLKPGGRIGVVEWLPSHIGHGPHPGARLEISAARALAEEAGFQVAWSRELNEAVYLLYARK